MIKSYFLILLMIASLFFPLQKSFAQDCADTNNIFTVSFNGKKYEIVKEMKNWDDAASCALERGGYLAEINSATEQAMVYGTIANNAGISTTYTSVTDGGGIAYIWIGATDKNTEGMWLWDGDNDDSGINFWNGQGAAGTGGGSAVNSLYNNWGGTSNSAVKEPDDYASNQDGAAIALAGWPSGTTILGVAGEWNDINLENTIYYVIEYDTSTSSMKDNELDKVLVYPNPANESVSIVSSKTIKSIELFSTIGEQVLLKQDINQKDINMNLPNLPKGIYWLCLNYQNSKEFKQLFIR